jgi:hypothetical protein
MGRAVASIKQIESQIHNREGFLVELHDRRERPRARLVDYDFERAARGVFTVDEWIAKRFSILYPNLDVYVLRPDGKRATARTTLARIRAEYEAAE